MRVLFTSRSGCANNFIKWATETLFVAQMGTAPQKEKLVSKILGVNAKVIKEVFNTECNTMPCVYLFTLNTVKELRESMAIDEKYPDDAIVCKYGFTKDLSRRTAEHIAKYEKIKNVQLKLKHYCYIDPQYVAQAESHIRESMISYDAVLDFENTNELVIVTKSMVRTIDDLYDLIGKKYMGHCADFVRQLREAEFRCEKMTAEHQFEIANLKHENKMLQKEFEIVELKMQLMQAKYGVKL